MKGRPARHAQRSSNATDTANKIPVKIAPDRLMQQTLVESLAWKKPNLWPGTAFCGACLRLHEVES